MVAQNNCQRLDGKQNKTKKNFYITQKTKNWIMCTDYIQIAQNAVSVNWSSGVTSVKSTNLT